MSTHLPSLDWVVINCPAGWNFTFLRLQISEFQFPHTTIINFNISRQMKKLEIFGWRSLKDKWYHQFYSDSDTVINFCISRQMKKSQESSSLKDCNMMSPILLRILGEMKNSPFSGVQFYNFFLRADSIMICWGLKDMWQEWTRWGIISRKSTSSSSQLKSRDHFKKVNSSQVISRKSTQVEGSFQESQSPLLLWVPGSSS